MCACSACLGVGPERCRRAICLNHLLACVQRRSRSETGRKPSSLSAWLLTHLLALLLFKLALKCDGHHWQAQLTHLHGKRLKRRLVWTPAEPCLLESSAEDRCKTPYQEIC